MADEFVLTQAAVDELTAELKYLRTTRRSEVAEKIKEAKSFGDLSENSEYDEAKSEQGKLEAQITEIEYTLQHVKIIDESALTTDTVHVGSKVTLTIKSTGMQVHYHIVGSPQADPLSGKLSDESPVGKGVLGHKVGDIVEIETPSGMMEVVIDEISK